MEANESTLSSPGEPESAGAAEAPAPVESAAAAPAPPAGPDVETILAEVHRWAVVDPDGIVHLKAGLRHGARAVGKVVRAADMDVILRSLATRFARLVARFETLRGTIERSTNRTTFLPRLAAFREEASAADVVGDLDSLLVSIDALAAELTALQGVHAQAKETLCAEAEALAAGEDLRQADGRIRDLQRRWDVTGSAGRETDDALWARFRGALETLRARRAQGLEALRASRTEARAKKDAICAEAEGLPGEGSWKDASVAFGTLQERWKEAGSAGREDDQALWKRFGEARKKFYEARTAFYRQRDESLKENQRKKEALLAEVEKMDGGLDPGPSLARLKTVREEWRVIGPAPREKHEELWTLFQKETQRVYREAKSEWSRRQTEWQTRLREAHARKEEQRTRLVESIAHDGESAARLAASLAAVRPGVRADEVRASIQARAATVDERLAGKKSRLAQLEAELKEIEKKLK